MSETTRPTTRATIISGPATFRNTKMPSRATSRMARPVMGSGILRLRWAADRIVRTPVKAKPRNRAGSDLHPHDLLVGRDHAVAHGHEGLEGGFALGDRGHDVDDGGLACGDGQGLRVRVSPGLPDGIEGRAEERLEVAPRR